MTELEFDRRFEEFRLQPHVLLPELVARLDQVARTAPEPGDVVCTMNSLEDRGLDEVELHAILGHWMHVASVTRTPRDSGHRLVAAGRLRHEHLGLCLTLDAPLVAHAESASLLNALADGGIVPAVLFVDAIASTALKALPTSQLRRAIRRLAAEGCRPGVMLSRVTGMGVGASAQIAAVTSLWPEGAQPVVQWTALDPDPESHARVTESLRAHGVQFDASLVTFTGVDRAMHTRTGAYLPSGAYCPQAFDLRTPAGRWSPERAVELVRVPLEDDGLYATWRRAWRGDLDRLQRLLDYYRIESYLRRIGDTVMAQRYAEFRVYNWPGGDPAQRTLLVDAGPVSGIDDARALVRDWERLAEERGPRWHTSPAGFFTAAKAEAEARAITVVEDALRLQDAEHTYLTSIPAGEPLRADVTHFVGGMPAALGRTLEIGSGFGRLARELAPRADHYVCLDLQCAMLAGAAGTAHLGGALGDFHQLPFRDRSFDTVIANNVLEHSYDPVAALREIRRVLAPGGSLHALIPLDALNPAHSLPAHLWKADMAGIRAAVQAAGCYLDSAVAIDLYAMGIAAAFPSCEGLVCRLHARRNVEGEQ